MSITIPLEGPAARDARASRPLAVEDITELAWEDFGLACDACGLVTLFTSGSGYPRCCARCASVASTKPM